METGARGAGRQERAGDRRRRPRPRPRYSRWAPRFPQGEVRHHRRQCRSQEARQCLGLRRAPGRDRLCGRCGGRPCCRRPGGVSYVGGPGDFRQSRNAGIEFGNGAPLHQSQDQVCRETTPAISTTSPRPKEADLGRDRPRGADGPLPHPQSRACAAWSRRRREKGTQHHRQLYTDRCGTDPLYVAYSITGVGFPARLRHRAGPSPVHGSRSSSRSASPWARNLPT